MKVKVTFQPHKNKTIRALEEYANPKRDLVLSNVKDIEIIDNRTVQHECSDCGQMHKLKTKFWRKTH